MKLWPTTLCVVVLLLASALTPLLAQPANTRQISGTVLNPRGEAIVGARVTATAEKQNFTTVTDAQGHFAFQLPSGSAVLIVSGKFLPKTKYSLSATQDSTALVIHVREVIPQLRQSVVITATTLEPALDQRNDTIYKNTLFLRDDQLLETLDSGINAGQHEDGGKSLEFRRFGLNLDHGGRNGGLKVLVDSVPQNQATQAHGQGYLGSLKSISPELVDLDRVLLAIEN